MQLKGKVAVITGAGRGIGKAIALAYAENGACVVCAARTVVEIEQVAEDDCCEHNAANRTAAQNACCAKSGFDPNGNHPAVDCCATPNAACCLANNCLARAG